MRPPGEPERPASPLPGGGKAFRGAPSALLPRNMEQSGKRFRPAFMYGRFDIMKTQTCRCLAAVLAGVLLMLLPGLFLSPDWQSAGAVPAAAVQTESSEASAAAQPASQDAQVLADSIPASGVLGVDISRWQGDNIDFAALRADGIQVVYIRAGEGDATVDPNFERNSAGAAAAGLDIGYYYYLHACTIEQAEAEADFFWSLIADKPASCRPAMDYESFCNQDRATINAIACAFLTRLTELCGEKALLYTDEYRVRTLWGDSMTAWPLWVADYAADSPIDLPSLGFWHTCAGFQYTDQGRLQGVPGMVDRDVFYASAFLGSDPDSGLRPLPPTPQYRTYTVRRGDTLWAISRRYGTTVQAIAQLNHIADPNFILPGWVLRIP